MNGLAKKLLKQPLRLYCRLTIVQRKLLPLSPALLLLAEQPGKLRPVCFTNGQPGADGANALAFDYLHFVQNHNVGFVHPPELSRGPAFGKIR